MSAASEVEREFNRQSYSEKKAIASSWESFLEFARMVLDHLDDIIAVLQQIKRVWDAIRGRY